MNTAERAIVERLVEALDKVSDHFGLTSYREARALIPEARKMLDQPQWVRVEDALPVVPVGAYSVFIWVKLFDGSEIKKQSLGLGFKHGVTHWRYAEPTPQPPEQTK